MQYLNYLGLGCALLSIVAFVATYLFAKQKPLRWRVGLFLITALLAIPALSFSAYYTHLLPETVWYYQMRSLRFSELLIPLIGVAGGAISALLSRFLTVFTLMLVVASSVVPFLKPIISPLDLAGSGRWRGDLCLQSTASTCGPASLATILKTYNIDATESEIAQEAHTYAFGTEAWYLARAVRRRGMDARFRFTEPELSDEPQWPAIVGVKIGTIGHFITILDYDADQKRYLVGDPFRSLGWYNRGQLSKIYDGFTGFYMEISED